MGAGGNRSVTGAAAPIVVGVDGSEPALIALRRALELADVLNRDLHIVTAVHLSGLVQAGLAMSILSEPEIEQQISDNVWSQVSDEFASFPDVEVTRVDRRGYPADELVAYAHEVEAEMVVVGTRGYGPIRSAVLGSTSHRVAQLCRQDVLIVGSD